MDRLGIGWLAVALLALIILVAAVLVYARFRRAMQSAEERLRGGISQVIETDRGPAEYATFGQGPPVLVVHGILGGFDQGLVIARGNVGAQYRSIVPSRFGYLRTPLPDDALPAGQADALASLLDTLGIQRAAILGTSAGGTSAIQFALRYPDRCSALILFSSAAPGETETTLPPEKLVRIAFKSDFIFWLLTTYFRPSLYSMMGVPQGFELTPEYEAEVAEMMKTLLPVHPRGDGAVFDMFVSNPDINSGYPLEEIAVPVLIISAVDDPLTLYVNAQSMAERIPDAKLVTVESGGHMLLGQEETVRSAIAAFLAELASE